MPEKNEIIGINIITQEPEIVGYHVGQQGVTKILNASFADNIGQWHRIYKIFKGGVMFAEIENCPVEIFYR